MVVLLFQSYNFMSTGKISCPDHIFSKKAINACDCVLNIMFSFTFYKAYKIFGLQPEYSFFHVPMSDYPKN